MLVIPGALLVLLAALLLTRNTSGDLRFPPSWTVGEYRDIAYIVRDDNNFPRGSRLLRL
jgi:hypothetical protein